MESRDEIRLTVLRTLAPLYSEGRYVTVSEFQKRLPSHDARTITKFVSVLHTAGILTKAGSRRDASWQLTEGGYALARAELNI
jgi:hypothetical protein